MSLYPRINYDDIIRQIEGAQKKANDANLARYRDLLAHIDSLGQQVGSAGTYGQAESYIQNIGNAARQRIAQTGIQQKGLADQDLISRGLGNTTIRTSAMRGIASDTERQMQAADEMEMTAKAGLMERRARDVCTRNPATIAPGALAGEALALMNARKIGAIFAVDGGGVPVGILHLHDCLRAGVA